MTQHPVDLEAQEIVAVLRDCRGDLLSKSGFSEEDFEREPELLPMLKQASTIARLSKAIDAAFDLLAEVRAARQARVCPHGVEHQTYSDCSECVDDAIKKEFGAPALASPSVPPPQTSPIVGLPPSPLSETERYARDASSKPSDVPSVLEEKAQASCLHDHGGPCAVVTLETAALKEGVETAELLALRQQIEDTIGAAQTESDADGWITAYHFKTGAIHRLLALARNIRDGQPQPFRTMPPGPQPNSPVGERADSEVGSGSPAGTAPAQREVMPSAPKDESVPASGLSETPGAVSQQPGMAPACPECGPLVTPEELRKLLDNAVPGVEELGRSLKKVFRLPDEDLILDAGAATSDPCGAPPSAPALPKEEVAPGLPCVHGRRGLCPHCSLAPAPLPEEQLPKDGTCETHQGLHERTAACVRWWPHAQPSGPAAAPAPGGADMKAARLLLGTGCVHEPDPATKAECVKCIAAEMARVRSDERERWMAQARGLQTVAGKCAPTAIVIPLGWLIRASDATSAGGGE